MISDCGESTAPSLPRLSDAFFSVAPTPLPHLRVGSEVDFNLCGEGGVWVPARVCELLPQGGLSIRAALTATAEICVPLPLEAAWTRLAPAGAHTIPLLDGQSVDFLRRAAPVPPSLRHLEQWQNGACCLLLFAAGITFFIFSAARP